MLRIKTLLENGRVSTLFYRTFWITIYSIHGVDTITSWTTDSLLEAGLNHLKACQKVKEHHVQRGNVSSGLLHGEGYQGDDTCRVSGGDDRPDREGPNQDGGCERSEVLPTDSAPQEDEGSSQL